MLQTALLSGLGGVADASASSWHQQLLWELLVLPRVLWGAELHRDGVSGREKQPCGDGVTGAGVPVRSDIQSSAEWGSQEPDLTLKVAQGLDW